MNNTEAGRILAVAISLDPKMPQPDKEGFLRGVWAKALHDVPFDDAEAAVMSYYRSDDYAQHRETISPADIVQWWNARRRPTERERSGLNSATRRGLPPADFDPDRIHDGVDRALGALARRKAITAGIDPDDADAVGEGEAGVRRLVQSVPCPHPSCHAGVGQRCVGPGGKPLTKTFAHPSRVDAAYNPDSQGA